MGDSTAIVHCERLTKVYRRGVALRDFTLSVLEGEVFGLVGPNGSGKTTFFKLLCGLVRPTSGQLKIFGEEVPLAAEKVAQVGFMIEEPAFYPWMDAAENLRVYALALGQEVRSSALSGVLELVGLGSVGKKKVRAFSQGMRQRLGIARALLLCPRLLVLDEPTNGLDPEGIVWLRNLIKSLHEDGRTVILASHFISEVQKVCTRVGFMSQGQLTGLVSPRAGDVDMERKALESTLPHGTLESEALEG